MTYRRWEGGERKAKGQDAGDCGCRGHRLTGSAEKWGWKVKRFVLWLLLLLLLLQRAQAGPSVCRVSVYHLLSDSAAVWISNFSALLVEGLAISREKKKEVKNSADWLLTISHTISMTITCEVKENWYGVWNVWRAFAFSFLYFDVCT